jgi:hypothetical protein
VINSTSSTELVLVASGKARLAGVLVQGLPLRVTANRGLNRGRGVISTTASSWMLAYFQ